MTYSYRLFLASWAKRLSWKEVAEIFGTSWNSVYRAIHWVVCWGLVHRDLNSIEAIGIDEIQFRRGHKYLTLVYQLDQGCKRLLYVAKDRTEASLNGFFRYHQRHDTQWNQVRLHRLYGQNDRDSSLLKNYRAR